MSSSYDNSNFHSSNAANGQSPYLPAEGILIDTDDSHNNTQQTSGTSGAYGNYQGSGVLNGQIVPSSSPQPATSYSLPTATMLGDDTKPQPPSVNSTQYQQAPGQNGAYAYATSVAGQPVLVSISPIGHTPVDPSLPAAHHENPVTKAIRRRNRRARRATAGGIAGIVTGAVVLGPFGILLGYAAGAATGAATAYAGERRKERRLAKERRALQGH